MVHRAGSFAPMDTTMRPPVRPVVCMFLLRLLGALHSTLCALISHNRNWRARSPCTHPRSPCTHHRSPCTHPGHLCSRRTRWILTCLLVTLLFWWFLHSLFHVRCARWVYDSMGCQRVTASTREEFNAWVASEQRTFHALLLAGSLLAGRLTSQGLFRTVSFTALHPPLSLQGPPFLI